VRWAPAGTRSFSLLVKGGLMRRRLVALAAPFLLSLLAR
jgi:hypothetical protein